MKRGRAYDSSSLVHAHSPDRDDHVHVVADRRVRMPAGGMTEMGCTGYMTSAGDVSLITQSGGKEYGKDGG